MNWWLVALVATAIAVVAIGWRTPWRVALAYAALYLTSTAALLSLIDAPRYAVFQHLRTDAATLSRHWLAALVLGVQVVVVLLRLGRRLPAFASAVLRPSHAMDGHPPLRYTRLRGAILLGTIGLGVAIPAANIGASLVEGAAALVLMLSALGNLVLAGLAAPAAPLARFDAWLSETIALPGDDRDRTRPWDARLPWWCAAFSFVTGGVVAWFVFDGVPHIDDSIAYLFQAKTFAAGRLTMPAPPDSASFHVDEVLIRDGKWFGYGFPGWPAVLSLGVLAGVPWLVNPAITAATVLIAHALLRATHGRGVANLTALLLAVSPWALFMSGEYLGHPAAAMWLLLALLGVQRARERASLGYAAVAGAAAGVLFLTRPLDAATGGLALGLWSLGFLGARRLTVGQLALASAIGMAMVLTSLAYNAATTGDPSLSPYNMWTDAAWGEGRDRLGFGADIGNRAWPNIDPLPGHGPADVVLNTNKNLFQTNVDLLGWAFGSLWLPVGFLCFGAKRRADWILLALLVSVPLGYSLYWFSGGPDHGPRYWYPILVPLLVATARGLEVLRASFADRARAHAVYPMVGCAVLGTMLLFVPWRAVTKYHRYRDVSAEIVTLARQQGIDGALIFVRAPQRADYQSAYNFNALPLDGPANVFARYLEPARRQQVATYFDRRAVWVAERLDETTGTWTLRGPYPSGVGPP